MLPIEPEFLGQSPIFNPHNNNPTGIGTYVAGANSHSWVTKNQLKPFKPERIFTARRMLQAPPAAPTPSKPQAPNRIRTYASGNVGGSIYSRSSQLVDSRLARIQNYRQSYNPIRSLMNSIPTPNRQPLIYRGLRAAGSGIGKVAGAPKAALGSAFDFVAKRPRALSAARFLGSGIGIGGLIGGAALGISYGVAAMGRARSRAPVVHTGAIRNTGQTNQYFNLGQDPFAGVRFAGKRR